MSRVETGAITFSDTTTPNQLRSAAERVLAVAVKARAGNSGSVYFGTDTTVSSTNGWELLAGDREDWSFTEAHRATAFHAIATDSGDVLDWAMEMEQ